MNNYLPLSWSVSRGQETYGYNICRLDDTSTGKRYKCMGGGYDMVGTVIGDWLQGVYQERLKALVKANMDKVVGYGTSNRTTIPDYYGLFIRADGSVHLDGACGDDSMRKIASAIGVELKSVYKRSKRIGFLVSIQDQSK